MYIKDLDKDFIEKKMNQSAHKEWYKAQSYVDAVRIGWRAAIRFAKKVEEADDICLQCGKLLSIEEEILDAGGNVFCRKCYKKVFNS